jgi:hypothetical protein
MAKIPRVTYDDAVVLFEKEYGYRPDEDSHYARVLKTWVEIANDLHRKIDRMLERRIRTLDQEG